MGSHHHHHITPVKKNSAASHTHHDMNPPMGHTGHNHHTMMIDDFKKRFWLSLILTVPILILSEMIQHWLGFEIIFPGDKYVLLILSSFIFFLVAGLF
jgi:Cu2+-exporting ATPase